MVKWQSIPARAQTPDERGVAADVELEDQREADQQRPFAARDFDQLLVRALDVGDYDGVTVLLQRGREIAQAEIALIKKADQENGSRRVAPALPEISWPIAGQVRLRHTPSAVEE